MGVPAFFRWLSRKYTAIVVHCVEEKPKEISGIKLPVDGSQPNPNKVEFDNLYLDMNGIIHPCCHPENKPAPKNEDEMMVLIFEYIDRIFNIVRPRKLLYMAIDGVAPRAKMNQQRSRRFRASKESVEKVEEIERIKNSLREKGAYVPEPQEKVEHFDSNCITPGTPFMDRLAKCLRYYIHDRLNNDPGWRKIKVILSDANVPGEGEHKIMDYIRRQRVSPEHDPNTHHCLCGADADLIMLGLATHEPNFTIIREEFKPNEPKPCEICAQFGHEMKECEGLPKEKIAEIGTLEKPVGAEQEFIFLRLNVLREYLERELNMPGLPFTYSFERAVDDWVFMCFFVGNDFLPHLPSLEIREGAIDRLVKLYKETVQRTGGYLTNSGVVNLSRVQIIMEELGKAEDVIFKTRKENDVAFKFRMKQKKKREKMLKEQVQKPAWMPRGQYAPSPAGKNPFPIESPRQTAYEMRMQAGQSSQNRSAESPPQGQKRKHEDSDSEEEPPDDVRLWENGWKDRYYKSKFDVAENDIEFRHQVGQAYVGGLCWVLRYYYQGCASWKWFFPYHYAPFASDFVNIAKLSNDFEGGTEPFKPLEQLMGVFPAASGQHVPPTWRTLMSDPVSPIIDFYPENFQIDLNGKKFAWQGVALLPFVDEQRLLKALARVYPDLTAEESRRNTRGFDRLFVNRYHKVFSFLEGLYEGGALREAVAINPQLTSGLNGTVWLDNYAVMTGDTVESPIPGLKPLYRNQTISVQFKDPQFSNTFLFPAVRLNGARDPERVLKPQDWNNDQSYRPMVGFNRNRSYASMDPAGHRMLSFNVHSSGGESRSHRDDSRSRQEDYRDRRSEESFSPTNFSPGILSVLELYSGRGNSHHLDREDSPDYDRNDAHDFSQRRNDDYDRNQGRSFSQDRNDDYNRNEGRGYSQNRNDTYDNFQRSIFSRNQEDNYPRSLGNNFNRGLLGDYLSNQRSFGSNMGDIYDRRQRDEPRQQSNKYERSDSRGYPPPPGRSFYRNN